jgi:DNA-directed RNA polymerase specialized sigma subunit
VKRCFEEHHAELAALADIIAYETRQTTRQLSHREIAALLGMSRTWVLLMEQKALAKMADAAGAWR